ncbi:hypothetical protein P691DRAFT_798758 [Macrolepiota fuliginosa MF-IS2]|uniref:DUF2423 domain-containing protein n=1 Tax=Macrolepiota fuliginosa MF-IS2 TaxID=1400762 RepID=A0A9P5XF91_9AGAR|nr:hypothetical protein P691DRAFT_798758 [Macrolepiota fuliginosa MF-IS2]
MAKSTRSKVKRAFRSQKRESGVYAATEAARLQRLNLKLHQVVEKDGDGDVEVDAAEESPKDPGSMQIDAELQTRRISTHGPRGSRREEWRKSKGLAPRPNSRGMNRQGGIAALRKAGRSKRRR